MTVSTVRIALPDGWAAWLDGGDAPQWRAKSMRGAVADAATPEGLLARVWRLEQKRVEASGSRDQFDE